MGAIKIYLEYAEHDAVRRYAEALGVSDEDIAYAALNRLMLQLKTAEEEIDRQVVEVRDSRQHSRSPFGDPAGPVPLPEGQAGDWSEPSHWR